MLCYENNWRKKVKRGIHGVGKSNLFNNKPQDEFLNKNTEIKRQKRTCKKLIMKEADTMKTTLTATVADKLSTLFHGVTIYQEDIPTKKFPCFLVDQTSIETEQIASGLERLIYHITICYYEDSQSKPLISLDDIGYILQREFNTLQDNTINFLGSHSGYDKINGGLEFPILFSRKRRLS